MYCSKKIISDGVFDPCSNKLLKFSTEKVVIEQGIINDIDSIIKCYNSSYLIADENTIRLLDKKLATSISHHVIPGDSPPSSSLIELIINKAKDFNTLVALGSGTINDLCKYASYISDKDYILFPTAASMNGYMSASASILTGGYKKSFQTHLPKAIYIDLDVVTSAPLRLTRSGFADFICRSTAQADWLLSHLLLNTEYNDLPFLLLRDIEQELLKEYSRLIAKDKDVVMLLIEALLLSGIGMTISGGSHPASQGEHMIAHAMDAVYGHNLLPLHGEKIAITTLTMAKLQEEKLLAIPTIKPTVANEKEIRECFGNGEFIETFYSKKISEEKAEHLNDIVQKNWSEFSEVVKKSHIPSKVLKKIFCDLGMATDAEDLGWNTSKYKKVVDLAFATRDRFTFLDIK
ncbi:iron-containing alcohol dehydrogenase [Candidatus Mesenet endosymbiont of Agriotes lineatus]|uniref:iron-containing alcohol dehydrogenase n=1 Tax=Candidatus Mesenet endosymbiont of Agriotes lineatus TaxID=3077948 RepID=UPI0030CBD9AC